MIPWKEIYDRPVRVVTPWSEVKQYYLANAPQSFTDMMAHGVPADIVERYVATHKMASPAMLLYYFTARANLNELILLRELFFIPPARKLRRNTRPTSTRGVRKANTK